jgi:AraC-like DNA-binding protein
MIKTILLLNPVYVTIFWALVLGFRKGREHVPKVFLGRFMMVAFVLYLSHFFYFTLQHQTYYYLDSIYTLASLLVYPLYHIYVRLLTRDTRFSPKTHGKYLLLPSLVFMLHLTGYMLMDKEEAMHYLMEVLPGHSSGRGLTAYMEIVYFLFRKVFILQALLYLYLNYRLIARHNERLKDFYSSIEGRNLNWVQFFNIILGLTSLASVAAAAAGRDAFASNEFRLAIPSVLFSIMLFSIGYLGSIQGKTDLQDKPAHYQDGQYPEGGNKCEKVGDRHNYPGAAGGGQTGMPSDDYHDEIKEKIDEIFEKEMIFRNPDLRIWDLCGVLGTNRTYVSRVINLSYGRNFCNHVNFYRVRYAKNLLRENLKLGNEEIAELSGFGSVNSLYRAFQTFENKSVGEFRKHQGIDPQDASALNLRL